jgi:DnaJ-domain-containing protein 1
MALIFGILVLVLVLWGLNGFAKADPKVVAKVLRPAGGIVMVGTAAFLLFRGQFEVGIPLGLMGLGMLGWGPLASTGWLQRTQKTPGQTSQVRTRFIEMELDHDSADMRGTVIAGRHAGASLDSLELSTLLGLLAEFDDDSRALLTAYLDRREPGWREHAQGDPAAGQGGARDGKMTEEQAYEVLGLPPGASADAIAQAHRTLMKKLHPDQGGSTYLAAQINAAKDVLLRRGRR